METRSQTRARAGRSPSSPEGVLGNPVPGQPIELDEDLGLATLMGDGEALIVGRGRAVVSAATSGPDDTLVVSEKGPAREPVSESAEPQPATADLSGSDSTFTSQILAPGYGTQSEIPTLVAEQARIPTLVSSGPGAQVGLGDWPPRASGFENTRLVAHDYCNDDGYDAYRDVNPVDDRYAVCHR